MNEPAQEQKRQKPFTAQNLINHFDDVYTATEKKIANFRMELAEAQAVIDKRRRLAAIFVSKLPGEKTLQDLTPKETVMVAQMVNEVIRDGTAQGFEEGPEYQQVLKLINRMRNGQKDTEKVQ